MKIVMINGSPKPGQSNSGRLLEKLEELFDKSHELLHLKATGHSTADYQSICQADVIVLAFPLYVDAIPSRLFQMMADLEQYRHQSPGQKIYVYTLVNNGFFEGKQNHIALDIVKNWCLRAGFVYAQGIGQGAGEMIGLLDNIPLERGPLKNFGKALQTMAQNIQSRTCGENLLLSPRWPRFAWRLAATHGFWHTQAKKNGLALRALKAPAAKPSARPGQ